MKMLLILLAAITIIILVILLPRETQRFSTDSTSNIGKSGYWQSNKILKIVTLIASILLFLLLILFKIISF
ncbi:MAG: accessory secretory protein Asp5 [Streptococcus sp.]|nr:accessory secretory protein Asp5 [Streptococcus sp.]